MVYWIYEKIQMFSGEFAMRVVGIIAEYNPLHNGHIYHLERARALSGADYCVVVMSGNFVQRGEAACTDKYTRAAWALKGGAAAIGGTFSGAGGGASFQTNAARPTAGTVQPVNYTVGSNGQPTAATGNTNINVYAYDSESLKDYVQKNKHTFADGVLAAGFENHPVRNGW